jgi:hypothetical protein
MRYDPNPVATWKIERSSTGPKPNVLAQGDERRHRGGTDWSRIERQSRWRRRTETSVRGINGRLNETRQPVRQQGQLNRRWPRTERFYSPADIGMDDIGYWPWAGPSCIVMAT